jgi:acetamidase/formamidase
VPHTGAKRQQRLCSVVGDLKISETVDLPNWLVSMTFLRGIFN